MARVARIVVADWPDQVVRRRNGVLSAESDGQWGRGKKVRAGTICGHFRSGVGLEVDRCRP